MRNILRDENQNHQPQPVDPLDLEITDGQYAWDPTMKLVPDKPAPHPIKQFYLTLRSIITRPFSKSNAPKK